MHCSELLAVASDAAAAEPNACARSPYHAVAQHAHTSLHAALGSSPQTSPPRSVDRGAAPGRGGALARPGGSILERAYEIWQRLQTTRTAQEYPSRPVLQQRRCNRFAPRAMMIGPPILLKFPRQDCKISCALLRVSQRDNQGDVHQIYNGRVVCLLFVPYG